MSVVDQYEVREMKYSLCLTLTRVVFPGPPAVKERYLLEPDRASIDRTARVVKRKHHK